MNTNIIFDGHEYNIPWNFHQLIHSNDLSEIRHILDTNNIDLNLIIDVSDQMTILFMKKFPKNILDVFIEYGLDINHMSVKGTALCYYMSATDISRAYDYIKILLELGANPNSSYTSYGELLTPLIIAYDRGYYNRCVLLLKYGANYRQIENRQASIFSGMSKNEMLALKNIILRLKLVYALRGSNVQSDMINYKMTQTLGSYPAKKY